MTIYLASTSEAVFTSYVSSRDIAIDAVRIFGHGHALVGNKLIQPCNSLKPIFASSATESDPKVINTSSRKHAKFIINRCFSSLLNQNTAKIIL